MQDLDVHKRSIEQAIAIRRIARTSPKEELFVLSAQLSRAAISVPCNLAEGAARDGDREFAHFLSIARGSCAEVLTLLEVCAGLDYIKPDLELIDQARIVAKMLTSLSQRTRTRLAVGEESKRRGTR
ncbi:MAG TPA: four helix bundle protein [Fimbriimonadaceae bacterium]|nr:four helix bundle protein [Fimbriimonadaceae bacterium]